MLPILNSGNKWIRPGTFGKVIMPMTFPEGRGLILLDDIRQCGGRVKNQIYKGTS